MYNLRRIRYRGGEVNGYPSRLHYIADWAVDNRHRGNFTDVSDAFPKVSYIVRTIDFMSRHADRYPALADSANLARIRDIESGYRMHRFPNVKTADLHNKTVRAALHHGDVVALVSTLRDLDVSHMGIVVMTDGVPYLLHASSSHGKSRGVEVPLADFLKRNRQWAGIRNFPLKRLTLWQRNVLRWFDMLKGIAILMVVMGHVLMLCVRGASTRRRWRSSSATYICRCSSSSAAGWPTACRRRHGLPLTGDEAQGVAPARAHGAGEHGVDLHHACHRVGMPL